MRSLADGDMDARTAHELGYLANAFMSAVSKHELEKEVKALRAEIAELQKRPRSVA